MSPALQGNLEVERYIGSYLISQRVPHQINTKTSTRRYQHNPNHQPARPKPAVADTEKGHGHRGFNKYCYPPREPQHHVGGPVRYGMPPVPVPVDCQMPVPGFHGGVPYKQHPGGAGWAGVPLISMTYRNNRNKKVPSAATNPHGQKYPNKPQQNRPSKDADDGQQHESDRSPLTRLAIHTQGAPLIQAGRFNNRCKNNYRDQSGRVYRSEGVRWDVAKDTKSSVNGQNKDQPCGNNDSSSVASDESSGNSENSLPRIIKPRKRRKKDRKPLTGSTSVTSTPNDAPQFVPESEKLESTTLKTFLPLCFKPDAVPQRKDSAPDLLDSNQNISPLEEKQSEDLIDPLTSADGFPLGNLLDDEEEDDSELTVCQCRYCDPSGVIWDVDQRCYSPFLTPQPPSPTASVPDNLFSPYRPYNTDLVSLLRRSWSDPSPYLKPELHLPSSTKCQDKKSSRPSSPGLQVSSEIVTSPNGHRDIEIKFYSASSPLDKAKVVASDREQDRCFVVEE